MIVVEQAAAVLIGAARRFLKLFVRCVELLGSHDKRRGENFRIFHRDLIQNGVAVAREALGDFHLVAVEVAVLAKPGIFAEVDGLDHQRVAFPMANGIAVIRRIETRAVRTSIDGNHAVAIARHVFVEENHVTLGLHDLTRRSDARHARLAAVKDEIRLAFVVAQVFYFVEKLRLVRRRGRLVGARARSRGTLAGEDVILIATLDRDRPVFFLLALEYRRDAARCGPSAIEIGTAVGRLGRRFRGLGDIAGPALSVSPVTTRTNRGRPIGLPTDAFRRSSQRLATFVGRCADITELISRMRPPHWSNMPIVRHIPPAESAC